MEIIAQMPTRHVKMDLSARNAMETMTTSCHSIGTLMRRFLFNPSPKTNDAVMEHGTAPAVTDRVARRLLSARTAVAVDLAANVRDPTTGVGA
jgi:hypothetical protein